MTAEISNLALLQALLPERLAGESFWVAAFKEDPSQGKWAGRPVTEGHGPSELRVHNNYFAVSTIRTANRQPARRAQNFGRMFVVVLDDLEGGPSLAPTYVLQTSLSKRQVGFRLREPVADPKMAERLMKELVQSGRLEIDHSGNNIVRYVRLPVGCNTKKAHVEANGGSPFETVLMEWHPECAYTVKELAEAFGLNLQFIESGQGEEAERAESTAPGGPPDVPRIKSALAVLDPDMSYDEWIRLGMILHAGFEGSAEGLAIFDEFSARGSKYHPGEPAQRWRTFGHNEGGVTLGSLFFMAEAAGWDGIGAEEEFAAEETQDAPAAPTKPVELAFASPEVVEAANDRAAEADAEAARADPQPLAVRLSVDDLFAPPLEEFVLGRMFPLAKSSVIYGPTSVGKSALLAQAAIAFAAGEPSLWGLPLHLGGGPVLIYSAEDTLDDWKRKAAAVAKGGGVDVSRAIERLWIIDRSEGTARLSEVLTVNKRRSRALSETRRVPQPTEEQARLIEAARKVEARWVIVETASRLVEDEDNASFSALQSALGRVGRETGAAVTVSHHATKTASKENDSGLESARGGGALVYNARNAISLFPASREEAAAHLDRFPLEDLFVLSHGKATSSTRRHAPLLLARCDAEFGAVFRPPGEVATDPQQEAALAAKRAARMAEERAQERERLGRLFSLVGQLASSGTVSPRKLREDYRETLGLSKHKVEELVALAVDRGVLVAKQTDCNGRVLSLAQGADPAQAVPPGHSGPPLAELL